MAEKTRCGICNRTFSNVDALAMHTSAKHTPPLETKKNSKRAGRLIVIGIIVLLIVGGFIFFNKFAAGNIINNLENNQEVQKITLSMKGNYYPNTIKVKANQPVEITLDNSVRGCYRSLNIRDLGVSAYSVNPSQVIKFTPTKKGSFEFACGMRMGYGTIVVE